MSSDEEEEDDDVYGGDDDEDYGSSAGDASFFTLEFRPEDQPGGFHVRNKAGQSQRLVANQFSSGPNKRPAFNVGSLAKAIVHGTLDQIHNKPATLLVYDFSFFSYRSRRIKDATIKFKFQPKKGSISAGPTVKSVAPFGRHVMMQTREKVSQTTAADTGISGGAAVTANFSVHAEKSVEKTTTHAAEVTGNNPTDEWGDSVFALWSLEENESQRSGIATLFRACILLIRDDEEEFDLFPTIRVTPDLKTRLQSLIAFRRRDDPVKLDPTSDPIDDLGGIAVGNRWNLGAVELSNLWDCTYYSTFGEAIKDSRPQISLRDPAGRDDIQEIEVVTSS